MSIREEYRQSPSRTIVNWIGILGACLAFVTWLYTGVRFVVKQFDSGADLLLSIQFLCGAGIFGALPLVLLLLAVKCPQFSWLGRPQPRLLSMLIAAPVVYMVCATILFCLSINSKMQSSTLSLFTASRDILIQMNDARSEDLRLVLKAIELPDGRTALETRARSITEVGQGPNEGPSLVATDRSMGPWALWGAYLLVLVCCGASLWGHLRLLAALASGASAVGSTYGGATLPESRKSPANQEA